MTLLHSLTSLYPRHPSGLTSYDISLADQTVIVKTSSVPYEDVLAKIKKTGKEVKSGEVVA
jgi:copper chaperone